MNITTDDPATKEATISTLYGYFISFLEEKGMKDGNEFAGTINKILSCSKRYIHIYDMDKSRNSQMVVYMDSCQMFIQFGIGSKNPKKTLYKNELENLRYQMSSGGSPELIDPHKDKFRMFFEDFKIKFEELVKRKYEDTQN